MQYEVNLFRVDTVAVDAATESITETITHRAGYKTSKDGKDTKWAWYKISDEDLQNARQAIRRFKSVIFPKRVAVEELRQEFNPYSGFVSVFLKWTLEYPRIQIYVRDIPHHVEIGGVEYIDTDTPPPNFEMSLNGALDEYEYSTGGFYNQCKAFKNYVAWVGNKANCNRTAQNVILAFDALVEALGECDINEFADLSKVYERTTKALEEMCAALADTQTQTAQGNADIGKPHPTLPKKQVSMLVRNAIATTWKEYKANPSNYAPDVIERKKGGKPTRAECIEHRGKNVIYGNKTLCELLDEVRNADETPEHAFERVLDLCRKSNSH